MRALQILAVTVVATIALAGVAAGDRKKPRKAPAGFTTAVKPYAVGVPGSGWETKPILSVGDVVPETGNRAGQYRMVGIPDGLGVRRGRHKVRVLMTHEMTQADVSEPRVGRPAQRGAFASELVLNRRGEVLSARRAFDTVYQDNTLVGPAAEVGNATPAFTRWCSAFLAGSRVGFDRPDLLRQRGATGRRPAERPRSTRRARRPLRSTTTRRTRSPGSGTSRRRTRS